MKKTNETIILGIDPGTATTGYGVITQNQEPRTKNSDGLKYVAHGIIKTPPEMPMGYRLLMLYKELTKIITQYKPQAMVIEQIFFGRNVKTGITVSQARGVIMLAAAKAGIEPQELQGLRMKKILCGDGHAEKKKIQQIVRKTLGLYKLPKPDDAADALALAICYTKVISDK